MQCSIWSTASIIIMLLRLLLLVAQCFRSPMRGKQLLILSNAKVLLQRH
jgi:hypothetical protein